MIATTFAALFMAAVTPPRQMTACPPLPPRLYRGSAATPALSGLQVAVLSRGAVICTYAEGAARWQGRQPAAELTSRHRVRIASISKLVVAMGVMRLAEEAKLDLDADVSRYLGFVLRNPAFPDRPVTLRHLLAHTSSVRDGGRYWLDPGETMADFFTPGGARYEGGAHLADGEGMEPGRYFTYANLNFGVAAAVIEHVTGTRFDRYLKTAVLDPLGIDGAAFNPCEVVAGGAPLATLYRKSPEGSVWDPKGPWHAQADGETLTCAVGLAARPRGAPDLGDDPVPGYVPGSNPTYFSPQGGLRAHAGHVARLLAALRPRDNAVLSEETVRAMLETQWQLDADGTNGTTTEGNIGGAFDGLMTRYGLSVHLVDLARWGLGEDAPKLAGHLGEAYGLLGTALIDPETGDGLVALVTGTADDPARHPGTTPLYRVEEEILRWWLGTFSPSGFSGIPQP